MSQRRRVPHGNTIEFLDATPLGLMKVKDHDEFINSSPPDFLGALKKANDETARTGNLFRAIRVPVPKALYSAPGSVSRDAAMRLIFEAVKIGKVEGTCDDPVGRLIYIIQPVVIGMDREKFAKAIKTTISAKTIPSKRNATRRGDHTSHNLVGSALSSSRGLLDATKNGLVEAKNPRKFLEDAPEGFLEAYEKAEKEAPGHMVVIRTPYFPGMSDAEAREATIDAAWRAYQKSGGFLAKGDEKDDQKKDKRAAGGGIAGTCDTHEKEEESDGIVPLGAEKNVQKKNKRAAGGGGIAGKGDEDEGKVICGLESLSLGAEKTDQEKDKKPSEMGGIADTHDPKVAVGGNSAVRRKKTARGRGTPLPILRQGAVTLQSSADIL